MPAMPDRPLAKRALSAKMPSIMSIGEQVRYALDDGVSYVDTIYDAETRIGKGEISLDAFSAIDRLAHASHPPYVHLLEEIHTSQSCSYEYRDTEGRAKTGTVTYSLFNQQGTSPNLTLVLLGWRSDYLREHSARGLAGLALADPEQRYIVVNHMGRGTSSPLPPSASWEMARNRSYLPAGAFLAQALSRSGIFKDAEAVNVLGESEGHRLGTAFIAHAGDTPIHRATMVDGPGLDGRSFGQLVQALKRERREHVPGFAAAHPDEYSRDLLLRLSTSGLKEIFSNGVLRAIQEAILHPLAMTRKGLEHDTVAALPNITKSLTVISPEASELTSHRITGAFLEGIAHRREGPIIHHRTVPGITHTIPGPGFRALLYTSPPATGEGHTQSVAA